MMLILTDRHNNQIAVNSDHILRIITIRDIKGIGVFMTDNTQFMFPNITIEEVVRKINLSDTNR